MRGNGVQRGNDGYASLTALILCAAMSILCAGLLSLTWARKQAAEQEFRRLQQQEAINTAVLEFAADVIYSDNQEQVIEDKIVDNPAGRSWQVHLVAQSEAMKWPLDRMGDVDKASLAHATGLSYEELADMARSGHNDCVRSLFSDLGHADPRKDLPRQSGALYTAAAKDGEVWRIRAVLDGRVEERRVRFLGETSRLFAVVSREDYSLGEMPDCTDLITTP